MGEIPNVLDALGMIVEGLGLEGKHGRIAIDLPGDYDWQRIDEFFARLSKEELVEFCNETTRGGIKKEYGAEAEYAETAIDQLVDKLVQHEEEKLTRKDNA